MNFLLFAKSMFLYSNLIVPVKVSIITVTYNSEKYLADCIESVRKQTYGNIEHIIVDGKSTDGTLKIIQKNSKSYC